MKIKLALIGTLLLFPLNGLAADMSETDLTLEKVYLSLHVTDWMQTRYIAKNPDRFSETNPILGKHPYEDTVNTYFLLTGLAHPLVTYGLRSIDAPEWVIKSWQVISIGIEGGCVVNNFRAGIKLEF